LLQTFTNGKPISAWNLAMLYEGFLIF